MTVLPELEQQLVRAAGQPRREVPDSRRRVRGWAAVTVACAIAGAVVLVFVAIGTEHPSRPHPQTSSRPPAPSVDPVVPATYAQACATTFNCVTVPPGPVPAALRRPFRLPLVRPGERCPTTAGSRFDNSELGGVGLGTAPVRPDIANGGDLTHGRIVLGTTNVPGWYGIKTVWYSLPAYKGPWSVRAARLSGQGRIDLSQQPPARPGPERASGGSRFSPAAVGVPPGDTINTGAGYRTDPRTTWITEPGCYAFEVDGLGFSELIVFEALAPEPLTR